MPNVDTLPCGYTGKLLLTVPQVMDQSIIANGGPTLDPSIYLNIARVTAKQATILQICCSERAGDEEVEKKL